VRHGLTSSKSVEPVDLAHLSVRAFRERSGTLAAICPSIVATVRLVFASALSALTACATGGLDVESGASVDATGSYRLDSSFDLSSNKKVVELASAVRAMKTDPTTLVIGQMLATMPTGDYKSALQLYRTSIQTAAKSKLETIAPGFATEMEELATTIEDAARELGLVHRLELASIGAATYTATIDTNGLRFTVGASERSIAFDATGSADVAIGASTTQGLHVELPSDGELAIASHTIKLPTHKVLRAALVNAVFPSSAPGAASLSDVLEAKFYCYQLGDVIADKASSLSSSIYEFSRYASYCSTAMRAIETTFMNRVDPSDPALFGLAVSGEATPEDMDGDDVVEAIAAGRWTGTFTDADVANPVDAPFSGQRI
jgi:hypothetical protein